MKPEMSILDGLASTGAPFPDPPPGSIAIKGGSLPENTTAAQQALLDAGAEIYEHGGRLVRVGRHDGRKTAKRPVGAPILYEITPQWLVDELTRRCQFVKFDKRARDWITVNAPRQIADTILARAGAWPFPKLAGFIQAPCLADDGRMIVAAGYDHESELYHVARGDPPEVADRPTQSDAINAAELFYQAVETFGFATNADASAALAAMLTAMQRRLLPAAPIVAVSASTPGTGKTLFANVTAAFATGRRASAMAPGKDPAEMEKRIDTLLLDADAIVLIDNVSFPLLSDTLCIVATEDLKAVRVLGASRRVNVPTNSTFILTGNNLTLLGSTMFSQTVGSSSGMP